MKLKDITKHLNFFRYHLLFFTFTPIVFSGIFYGANGDGQRDDAVGGVQKVDYIDSLFLCFSAMTVTGAVTVNISTLQPIQQVILFFLFVIGDFTFVSWFMVLVRKRFFRRHCEKLLLRNNLNPKRTKTIFDKAFTLSSKITRHKEYAGGPISGPTDARPAQDYVEERMESPVDMRGSERPISSIAEEVESPTEMERGLSPVNEKSGSTTAQSSVRESYAQPYAQPGISISPKTQLPGQLPPLQIPAGRTRTIQISATSPRPPNARQQLRARSRGMSLATISDHSQRQATSLPQIHNIPEPDHHKNTGMGGFPTPVQIFNHLLPTNTKSTLRQRLAKPERRYTLFSRTETIQPTDPEAASDDSWDNVKVTVARWMPEKLGGLVIGRNSRFFTEELDDEALEQLGGVEYRALRLLSYLVPAYMLVFQLIPFAIIAIYFFQVSRWNPIFQTNIGVQQNDADKTWSSLFLVVSAYAGCGMSLVDQSLYPLSTCYLVVFVMVVVLLAGNHALPMMLRLIIWIGTKIWRKGQINETLNFLLDHPRRCFLYLFPSHQTWYLVFVLIAFILVEVFAFLVLNIGLPVLDDLNGFQMFADALLQSLSVRAAGFGVVPLANMAPAVLFFYVILMYVAIYPIAMSVRSTNVYEEKALGVYEPEDPETSTETEPAFQGKKGEVFSKYLAWHLRRQIAFDIWPLTFAIFLICIIERDKLMDNENATWFTIFRVIFECTSAYATIGLSLGTPNNNFSFTGEFKTLSKLVIIVVMLRGRHRGLPVAIDRAVLLPHAYARFDQRGDGSEGKEVEYPNDQKSPGGGGLPRTKTA